MEDDFEYVSTHSRPKAAGCGFRPYQHPERGFNTQPPEGGWFTVDTRQNRVGVFQHTAARRRLGRQLEYRVFEYNPGFNTQPPEGGWLIHS